MLCSQIRGIHVPGEEVPTNTAHVRQATQANQVRAKFRIFQTPLPHPPPSLLYVLWFTSLFEFTQALQGHPRWL